MKKTHKNIVGLCGLGAVIAMTIFAAMMPGPKASAANPNSYMDELNVRVIDEIPSVELSGIASGDTIVSLDEEIVLDYTNTTDYTVTVTYTDPDGNTQTFVIADTSTPEEIGSTTFSFRDIGGDLGYGTYVITATGNGLDGSAVEDSIEFEYVAVKAEIDTSGSEGEGSGTVVIDLDYDNDKDTVRDEDRITSIIINIYDADGNLVEEISPISVNLPDKTVEIPFDDYDIPEGDYTIVIDAMNHEDKDLYKRVILTVHYDGKIVVPDTGNFFKNLNIASSDYLITGIGVFLVVGIGGLVLIGKRNKR